MSSGFQRFLYGTYFAALCALTIFGGGLLYLAVLETPPPPSAAVNEWRPAVWGVAIAGIVVLIAALCLASRKLLFATVLFTLISGTTLVLAEIAARSFAPPWPASALHGVEPAAGRHSWGRLATEPGAVGLNSWGQRDRERTRLPAAGVQRIAFIGDSLLEETPRVPVSLQVEQKLGRQDLEVINLGVSATGPEEYHYRTKHVAVPLGVDHCVWFVFAGNDFVEPPRTLEGFCGIVAVSPRGSFSSLLGLRGLNHVAMNRRRPVLQAWATAGDLWAREQHLHSLLVQADDSTIRQYLLWAGDLPPAQRRNLAERLNRPEMEPFFAMLREPDEGWFRSYYLSAALSSAAAGNGQWDPNSEADALYWVEQTHALCRQRGIRFTLVIVPEAFQVDDRMREQWMPLVDMRHVTAPCREAADRLCKAATERGIDLLDLHDVLENVPGAYLNLDGHWSERGAERVAEAVAAKLQETSKSFRKIR